MCSSAVRSPSSRDGGHVGADALEVVGARSPARARSAAARRDTGGAALAVAPAGERRGRSSGPGRPACSSRRPPRWRRTPGGRRGSSARRAARGSPARRPPAGVWRKSVCSVRKRPISRSGLTPGSSLRKSLRISRSPKRTEVLLWSARAATAGSRSPCVPAELAKSGEAVRRQLAAPAPEALAVLDRGEQLAREAGLSQRIVEQPRALGAVGLQARHARQRRRSGAAIRSEGQRQGVGLRPRRPRSPRRERSSALDRCVRRWDRLHDLDPAQRPRPCRRTSGATAARRAGRALEIPPVIGPARQLVPGPLDGQHRHRHAPPPVPAALPAGARPSCAGSLHQREPEKRWGPEGEAVADAADARERRAAEQLDRASARRSAERSSSAYWAKRERLATTRSVSSSVRRRKASTRWFSGCRNSIVPRLNAGWRLRRAMSRRIHQSSECGLVCCASTLTAS